MVHFLFKRNLSIKNLPDLESNQGPSDPQPSPIPLSYRAIDKYSENDISVPIIDNEGEISLAPRQSAVTNILRNKLLQSDVATSYDAEVLSTYDNFDFMSVTSSNTHSPKSLNQSTNDIGI